MTESDSPWPKSGDILFRQDEPEEWWRNACLGWSRDEWLLYAEGYLRATELLLEHVLTSGSNHDTLVYPIIFNARHYLEIKLKYLRRAAAELLDDPSSLTTEHFLRATWKEVRPLLERIFAGQDNGELDAVETVLLEFEARDPRSMSFRYPVDTKGKRFNQMASTIGLSTFQTTFKNVSSFLEAADTAIQEYSEFKHESEAGYPRGT